MKARHSAKPYNKLYYRHIDKDSCIDYVSNKGITK